MNNQDKDDTGKARRQPDQSEETGRVPQDREQDWPLIDAYTRAQAIADGVLVDLMKPETVLLVRDAGFKHPVAMTIGAFSKTVSAPNVELPPGQDLKGRLWDVLWMLKCAIRRDPQIRDRVPFSVRVWNGHEHHEVKLWSLVGPGDTPEPVITIMLQGED